MQALNERDLWEGKKRDTEEKEKSFRKKLKKLSKKYWQEDIRCDILFELSRESGKAIGPWKLNNEIRKGTRDSMVNDHQEEF